MFKFFMKNVLSFMGIRSFLMKKSKDKNKKKKKAKTQNLILILKVIYQMIKKHNKHGKLEQ